MEIRILQADGVYGEFGLRIPGWCTGCRLAINGQKVRPEDFDTERGYLMVKRVWKEGDLLDWVMDMEPHFVQADRRVYYNAGKAALVRGPLVYCMEEADNGPCLHECRVDAAGDIREKWEKDMDMGGYCSLSMAGVRYRGRTQEKLYDRLAVQKDDVCLKAVPYFLWNNRGQGEMVTWVNVM